MVTGRRAQSECISHLQGKVWSLLIFPSQNECSWHFLSKQACFAFSGGKIQLTRLEQPFSWLMEDHSLLSLNQMLVHRVHVLIQVFIQVYSELQNYCHPGQERWYTIILIKLFVFFEKPMSHLLFKTIVFSFENIYGRMISTSKMSSLKQNPDRCLNLVASANTICASKSTHCKQILIT